MTILEALIAAMVLCIAVTALGILAASSIRQARITDQVAMVEANLVTRMDQMKARTWSSITSSSSVQSLLTSAIPETAAGVSLNYEEIAVMPVVIPAAASGTASGTTIGTASNTPYFTVRRTGNAAPVVTGSSSVSSLYAVKVRIRTGWNSPTGVRFRETNGIFSRSGGERFY